jgi:hypothetical protein
MVACRRGHERLRFGPDMVAFTVSVMQHHQNFVHPKLRGPNLFAGRRRMFVAIAVAAAVFGAMFVPNLAAAAEGDRLSAEPYMNQTFRSAAFKAFTKGGLTTKASCSGRERATTSTVDAYGNNVTTTRFRGTCTSPVNNMLNTATCTGTRTRTHPTSGRIMLGGSMIVYSARCVYTNASGTSFTGTYRTTIW